MRRIINVAAIVLIAAALAPAAFSFSILGHRIIALRVLEDARRNPHLYPQFFKTINANARLVPYFVAGSEAADFRIAGPKIQDSTHYEHPGLWMKTLLTTARTDEEKAYAWGWVTHFGADLHCHSYLERKGLNYCDAGVNHIVFETTMDAMIGQEYQKLGQYAGVGTVTHPEPFLRGVMNAVAAVKTSTTGDYGSYMKRLTTRCGAPVKLTSSSQPLKLTWDAYMPLLAPWTQGKSALEPFRLIEAFYPSSTTTTARAAEQEFRRLASTAASSDVQQWSLDLANAISKKAGYDLSKRFVANNAEIVGLYGLVSGNVINALSAADTALRQNTAAAWSAIDRNFDTGESVKDPSLK